MALGKKLKAEFIPALLSVEFYSSSSKSYASSWSSLATSVLSLPLHSDLQRPPLSQESLSPVLGFSWQFLKTFMEHSAVWLEHHV